MWRSVSNSIAIVFKMKKENYAPSSESLASESLSALDLNQDRLDRHRCLSTNMKVPERDQKLKEAIRGRIFFFRVFQCLRYGEYQGKPRRIKSEKQIPSWERSIEIPTLLRPLSLEANRLFLSFLPLQFVQVILHFAIKAFVTIIRVSL